MNKNDPLSNRFALKKKQEQLGDLARKARSKEDVDAEQELIKKTPKIEPIKKSQDFGRNDPCACGSGKKYKKCCGAEK